jgi:uncharacterized protein YkwD
MKTIIKNSLWVSTLTLSVVSAGSYDNKLTNNEINNGTESYQTIRVAGDSCEITDQQQHMLDLINEVRTQARSCGDEFYQAAAHLTWSCQLSNSATAHTKDMTTNNFFSHTGSDGLRAGDRLLASGYDWDHYGENLAAGFIFAEQAIDGFLDNPGHCKNIMDPDNTSFGSHMEFSADLEYQSYWTQLFSASM